MSGSTPLVRFGLLGFVFAGLDRRLRAACVRFAEHLRDECLSVLPYSLPSPPHSSTEPSPAFFVSFPFSTKPIFSSQRWKGGMAVRPNSSRSVAVSWKPVV